MRVRHHAMRDRWPATPSARRAADLFFADLMGRVPPHDPAVEGEETTLWTREALAAEIPGALWSFTSVAAGCQTTAVYLPPAVRPGAPLNLLVWIAGLPVCGAGHAAESDPVRHLQLPCLSLARLVAESGRPLVLVAPKMKWRSQRDSVLATPATFNRFVAEVRFGLVHAGFATAPPLRTVFLAGHSRAYGLIDPLARAHADSASSEDALAALREVWAIDTLYSGRSCKSLLAWAMARPDLKFEVAYLAGSSTATRGGCLAARASGYPARRGCSCGDLPLRRVDNLHVTAQDPVSRDAAAPCPGTHCKMPALLLPGLLSAARL